MLAHARLGWPLQVGVSRRDGFEPEEIYAALSWTQRLQGNLRSPPSPLPILLSRRASKAATAESGTTPRPRTLSDPEITRQVLLKTLSNTPHAPRHPLAP